ncbi:hypothetical protein Bbelb_218270 [Branchiostoma belcheri]|nr:hypothetical protein Bbelb_218270 [Branchiostoma belcheri]
MQSLRLPSTFDSEANCSDVSSTRETGRHGNQLQSVINPLGALLTREASMGAPAYKWDAYRLENTVPGKLKRTVPVEALSDAVVRKGCCLVERVITSRERCSQGLESVSERSPKFFKTARSERAIDKASRDVIRGPFLFGGSSKIDPLFAPAPLQIWSVGGGSQRLNLIHARSVFINTTNRIYGDLGEFGDFVATVTGYLPGCDTSFSHDNRSAYSPSRASLAQGVRREAWCSGCTGLRVGRGAVSLRRRHYGRQ